MARAGPLAAAAVQQGMPTLEGVQPNPLTDKDYDDNITDAPVPRWLVTTLNCVMLGGVAATVSVALLSMRRSSSFGSKSKAHADAMADILTRAGKRRGWTATRTERVLHLIGVQRRPVQVEKSAVPGSYQHAPTGIDRIRPRVLNALHDRPVINLHTRPQAAVAMMPVSERGRGIPRANLTLDHNSHQRASARGERVASDNSGPRSRCVPALYWHAWCDIGQGTLCRACYSVIAAPHISYDRRPSHAVQGFWAAVSCTAYAWACHSIADSDGHTHCASRISRASP
jgi:hypothetical protein